MGEKNSPDVTSPCNKQVQGFLKEDINIWSLNAILDHRIFFFIYISIPS